MSEKKKNEQTKRTTLVIEHIKGILRAAISRFPGLVTEFARGKSCVYELYKGLSLHYIGLAKKLRLRMHYHLRDCHAEGWNRYSTRSIEAHNHMPQKLDRPIKRRANIYSPLVY